jgi:hypothetical protein
MKKIILSVIALMAIINISFSQDFEGKKGSEICSMKKSKITHPERYFQDSPGSPRHSYDVLNYTLKLDLYNCFTTYVKNFNAYNIITFRVDSTLNNIKLNANNTSLAIDSVRLMSGTPLVFTHSSYILTIILDTSVKL